MIVQPNNAYPGYLPVSISRQKLPLQTTGTASVATTNQPKQSVTLLAAAKNPVEVDSGSSYANYDFTHMTPKQMQAVAQQLHKSGQIDVDQLFTLQNMGVPLGKVGPNGSFVELTPEERTRFENSPVNYIDTTKSAIRFLQETGYAMDPKSGYEQFKSLLATLLRVGFV